GHASHLLGEHAPRPSSEPAALGPSARKAPARPRPARHRREWGGRVRAPDWRAWRARSRWLHWVVCGLGVGNVVLGNVVEGLVMLTICVLVERGLDWLNRTDHELQARIDAV